MTDSYQTNSTFLFLPSALVLVLADGGSYEVVNRNVGRGRGDSTSSVSVAQANTLYSVRPIDCVCLLPC